MVQTIHGASAAHKAKELFIQTFSHKETPDDIPTIRAPKGSIVLVDFMLSAKLASSKSEARRLIEQGGVSVNKKKVTDGTFAVALKPGDVIQVGKRRFVRIV